MRIERDQVTPWRGSNFGIWLEALELAAALQGLRGPGEGLEQIAEPAAADLEALAVLEHHFARPAGRRMDFRHRIQVDQSSS